ncbi:MAG: VWA domain-containing protein [Planctomycetaceae bacterium]
MKRLLSLAALMAVFAPVSLPAQGILIATDPNVIAPLPRPIPLPVPHPPASTYRIKGIAVQASIRDQIAQVQVSQSFVNTGSTTMEVEFCFPLPYDGAIDRLTLMVDGKEFQALLPAGEARALYESIVRKNRDPALLEWIGSGMFRTSVFPVPPGQERKVSLKYTQLLRSSQQLADFLFPLSTAKYTSQPVEQVQFRVALETTTDLKSVYSPTHTVNVERPDARHAVVTYSETNAIPTSDFRLFYDVAAGPVGASVLSYRPSGEEDGYFVLLAAPQIAAPDEARPSKNIVFVLDRSGSMEGKKIEQAREALRFVLNNLREGDRFNIVAYDSSVETFRPDLQTFNDETRAAAIGFVNGIYAGGGTNIGGALGTGLAQFKQAEGPSYLLFLTDGLPTVGETNESKLVAASKQANPGKVRVISFGVGYDVNSRLLDRLTHEHHGQSEYVRPEDNIEVHVSRLYKKISAPVMTDVAVNVEFDTPTTAEQGAATNRLYPRMLPDLFEGEQLVLVGRYKPTGRAKVTLTGTVGGKSQSFDFPAGFTAVTTDISLAFVEKLWAMRRIGEIIDEIDLNGKNDELVQELVVLSTKHGILTPYTSFLADESGRELAQSDRYSAAGAAVERLSAAEGRSGFRQREFKQSLQQGGMGGRRAPASRYFDSSPALLGANAGGAVPAASDFGSVAAPSLSSDAPIVVSGLKTVGDQTLYRRGQVFMTAGTQGLDLERDKDKIKTVERFSPEYFKLVAANTAAENALFSSQQADEQLLVELRGQVYLVK